MGPTVSRFNFDINPSANLPCGRKSTRSTRDLLKTTVVKRRWRAVAPDCASVASNLVGDAAPQEQALHSIQHRIQQEVQNRCLTHGKQLAYRNFKISTARIGQLTWIAYFGRSDGQSVLWDGTARPIVETAPYSSEILAIADAEISIDDLMACVPPTRDNEDHATNRHD
jgi:hypothetical protein